VRACQKLSVGSKVLVALSFSLTSISTHLSPVCRHRGFQDSQSPCEAQGDSPHDPTCQCSPHLDTWLRPLGDSPQGKWVPLGDSPQGKGAPLEEVLRISPSR
jgi:hypothetical protein